jgi:hypothetical protein|tara:strand:- start:17 stop:286 length:270 start_codon:yes stop_codon:yes gene_type:complete
MALAKEIVVDKIEVQEKGEIQVRTVTRIKEDGVVLSSSFHRHVVQPSNKVDGSWVDTVISGEDARVQAIATAAWTDAVKTAWQEYQDAL